MGHLFIWVLFAGAARLGLGQGNVMKVRTDNECALHLVLIGPQFICYMFLFRSIAMGKMLDNWLTKTVYL